MKKPTLLIVEQEQDYLENLLDVLEDDDHFIVTASDVNEALEIIVSRRPDCILTSLTSSQDPKLGVLKKARKHGFDQPVVLLSSDLKIGHREGEKIGAFDVVDKAADPEDLRYIVQEALWEGAELKEEAA